MQTSQIIVLKSFVKFHSTMPYLLVYEGNQKLPVMIGATSKEHCEWELTSFCLITSSKFSKA